MSDDGFKTSVVYCVGKFCRISSSLMKILIFETDNDAGMRYSGSSRLPFRISRLLDNFRNAAADSRTKELYFGAHCYNTYSPKTEIQIVCVQLVGRSARTSKIILDDVFVYTKMLAMPRIYQLLLIDAAGRIDRRLLVFVD